MCRVVCVVLFFPCGLCKKCIVIDFFFLGLWCSAVIN